MNDHDGQVGAVGIHLDGHQPAGVLDLALGGQLSLVRQGETADCLAAAAAAGGIPKRDHLHHCVVRRVVLNT